MARGPASSDTQAFALRLRATRLECGYKDAAELARAIGVEPPAYRKWERGEAEPGIADLARIQRLTNVSLDFLIAGRVPVATSPQKFPGEKRAAMPNKTGGPERNKIA